MWTVPKSTRWIKRPRLAPIWTVSGIGLGVGLAWVALAYLLVAVSPPASRDYGVSMNAAALLTGLSVATGVLWAWWARKSASEDRSADLSTLQAAAVMATNQLLALIVTLQVIHVLHDQLYAWLSHHVDGLALVEMRVVPADTLTARSRLVLSGTLGNGSAAEVKSWLEKNPDVRTVELDFSIGLNPEALLLADIVGSRELDTVVKKECTGLCPLVFLSGARRTAGPDTVFFIHRTSVRVWGFLGQGSVFDDVFANLVAKKTTDPTLQDELKETNPWTPKTFKGKDLIEMWFVTNLQM